jgi:hypothetical protein
LRRTDRYGIWVLLALAAALRCWTITSKNLWLDESTSWDLATSSVPRLISWTASDIHPPLYYLILKGWVAVFGDSLIALRGLSVVASLVSVWLLLKLLDGAVPRVVAYVAVFWFAVSPHAIYYAQETRMYALATASVLGACLAYRRWVDSGFTRRTMLVAYAACAAVAIYLHYFTALALAAIWVHFVVAGPKRSGPRTAIMQWLVAHVAIGVVYLPWITTAIAQITRGQSWRQPVTIGQIPDYTGELLRMLTFGMYDIPYIRSLQGLFALGVLSIGLVAVVIAAFRPKGEREAFFASMAIVPIVLGLSLLPRSGHMDLSRYLPYAVPLLIAAAACGVSALPLRTGHAAAFLLIGTLGLFPSLRAYYRDPVKDSDARPIVAYLLEHARRPEGLGQDTIYIAPEYMTTMVAYISRQSLGYKPWPGELIPKSGQPAWLVMDYRSPEFGKMDGAVGVDLVDVPGNAPARMRLFRLRVK